MNQPQEYTPENGAVEPRHPDNLRRLLMQDYALGVLYGIHKDEKARTAAAFNPGEKAEITNKQGVKVGSVSMSQPKKRAVPDDDSVLLGYAVEHGHEVEDRLPAPGTPEYNRVIDLIYTAGLQDELLTPGVSKETADDIRAEVLEAWEFSTDGEVPTGWTIRDASEPRFTLTKGRSAAAKKALEAFTAPVRDALDMPEFRQIEEGK